MKVSTLIIVIVSFIIGIIIGTFSVSTRLEEHYNLGLVSFCKLTEEDRFKICPAVRTFTEFPDGGNVTIYICNEKLGYMETNNLTGKSKKEVMDKIKFYKENDEIVVKELCKTETVEVFKFSKDKNGWTY